MNILSCTDNCIGDLYPHVVPHPTSLNKRKFTPKVDFKGTYVNLKYMKIYVA